LIVTNGYCGGGCAERRAEAVDQAQQQQTQQQQAQQQTQQMARPQRPQQPPAVAVGPGGAQLRVVR
jgi:hypothetical protein